MRFLKTNTATRITVGPFLDVTDAKTPETALTATNEKLTLVVDDAGVPTLVLDTTATASGGANDFVHITGDDAGYYDLELAAANVNYVGRATLAITYATDHLPVFHEFMILSANAYDTLFGTSLLTVNATQVNGTAQTAGDLAALVTTVDTVVDSILADTGTDGVVVAAASKSGYALTATTGLGNQTANITGNLSGSVGSVTGAVGSVTGAVGSVTGAVGSVTGNVGGNVTGSVGSIASGGITAASLAADVQARLGIVAYGTAQAATSTTLQLASSSAFANDELNGSVVVITGGTTGVGQSRMITDYVSSTDTATVDAWTTTPTGTISYVVFAAAPASSTSLPAVNVTQISGDATAADNLELACDGTGYPLGGGSIVAASVTGNVGGNVTGSVGSVTGDVGGNVNGSVAAVVAIGTGAITAASIATGAIDADAIATDAVTEIQSGLATASALSTVAGYIDTEVAAIKAKTDLIPAAPAATGDIPTAAAIADAVWDEALAGHAGAGSAGLALSTASSGGVDPSVLADAIWDEALSGHATAGTAGKALSDVLVDTAEIGTAGAGLTALAMAANLSTVAGYLDTEVAAIKAKTDNLPAAPAATGDIPSAAAVADAVWDEARSGHVTAGSFGAGVASVEALGTQAKADVNAEVLDVLVTDTHAEPASVPAATSSLRDKIAWLFTLGRNKVTQTATTQTLRNDADSGNIATATVSDDATTFTKGEWS